MTLHRLLVERAAINRCRLDEAPLPAIADGEVLAEVEDFALTANNISYALSGEMIGYWRFFPTGSATEGVVPVWGFARVVDSRCDALPVGSRFWGFLPMASHVAMKPGKVRENGFVDAAAHRADLPMVYNLYQRVPDEGDPLAGLADARSLTFPLFTTSWLIADYLADNALFGASQVIIGSASSKTGFGTAWNLGRIAPRPASITGLTSPRNTGFVEGLGFYDRVLAYDAVGTLDPTVPSVFVDMAGDGAVLAAVHKYFGDALKASIGVGATHWESDRATGPLPGPKPAFFFAPGQIEKRNADWGEGEAMRRATGANIALASELGSVLRVRHHQGAAAVAEHYAAMVAGETPPDEGVILRF